MSRLGADVYSQGAGGSLLLAVERRDEELGGNQVVQEIERSKNACWPQGGSLEGVMSEGCGLG